ncbi:penicillin-binding protein 2 [Longimicrobium terrae]|uniref:Penicillin-binding protein 2 n=1 Tax=Longimicrobium terrae TaxID=1639882 RepID=A0A841H0F7_9BACT|nr:penicillin-binding protein 2 [Longimicrobium terrae]MBB4637256.1 penicillin-binding protein 2 [Longimicrobium terrae]MBB6071482.1 penicillin-binding protein 2 [Longimicrobium terrae]NNC30095.1 penicillin-binding protein 2 [Longimicrobium terrae]
MKFLPIRHRMSRFQEFSARPADPFHPHSRRQRALGGVLFVFVALGLLGSAFFRTQVMRNSEFALRSDDNRFEVLPTAAPRGAVLDRNGKLVAETVTGYNLMVDPGPPDSVRARLAAVTPLLGLDTAAVEQAVRAARRSRGKPVRVTGNLSFEQVSRLEERRGQIRGVRLEAHPVRRYPAGSAVAHVVGYVLEINDRELKSKEFEGYRQGQHIGKTGVERQYERQLGGTAGAQYIEVDARGRVLGQFAPTISEAPKPGADLKLTLDLDLQRYAQQVFPAGMRGSVVAMVPSTGEILAMYSAPSYDPNLFVGGVSATDWARLNGDPSRPMVNRAIAGVYPPASTWKLATAIMGLERGVITPDYVMPVRCTGGMAYAGRYARCMKREGHGPQNLTQAIANSCNVYFYQLGIRLGIDNLTREGTRLGFGRSTGIDMPGEKSGVFPTGRGWYVDHFGWRPPPSEVMNLSIGQGPNSQTPLRMAQFYSAMAGNGTARRPHILMGADAPIETNLGISRQTLAAVWEGMAAVIEEGGTAHAVELTRWKLYGKTGTSQNSTDPKRPHAWFAGFAGPRGGQPEIVVTVIVEFGESGSHMAAPVAARMADFYLNKKHGFRNPPLISESLGVTRSN